MTKQNRSGRINVKEKILIVKKNTVEEGEEEEGGREGRGGGEEGRKRWNSFTTLYSLPQRERERERERRGHLPCGFSLSSCFRG